MRISCFALEPFEKKYLKEHLQDHELRFDEKPLSTENVHDHSDAEAIIVFVFSKVTGEIIDSMQHLKLIATMSTGYDHIDMKTARERNIAVTTVPAYGQNTVAEHAFGLLLALNRHIVEAVRRTRECNFDFKGLMGMDLKGKMLGIVGCGHIGQHMIRYAKAFGMDVIVSDVNPDEYLARELGFMYVSKEDLCRKSDVISLHVPLIKATYHFIGEHEFSLMKEGVLLINTGRGPLIDTSALIKALDEGKVGGAALDVLEQEDDLKKESRLAYEKHVDKKRMSMIVNNHELLHRPNVIITPHLAFYTQEALERILDTTVHNIMFFVEGKYLENNKCL
ncbi:MAG: NAD(P)-dependent oxidoreductase [Nanobdellota archaeon]